MGGFRGNVSATGNPGDADPSNFTACLLMLRWYQASVTFPIFRQHCDHCERRAWLFPSVYAQLADALRLRHALVPYIYSAARAAALTGLPLVRPMYYEFPGEDGAYAATHQYMFGDDVLSAPISQISWSGNGGLPDNTTKRGVWLPPGEWSAWAPAGGAAAPAVFAGPAIATVAAGFADIPLFVRAGALLPLQAANLSNAARAAPDIEWALFPAGSGGGYGGYNASAELFEDDGESAPSDGSGGVVTRATATVDAGSGATTLSVQAADGAPFAGFPARRGVGLQIRAPRMPRPAAVTCDGAPLAAIDPAAPDDGVAAGWFVVPAARGSLAAPAGTLIVRAGALSTDAAHAIEVTF